MARVLGVDLAYRSIAMAVVSPSQTTVKKVDVPSKVTQPQQIVSGLLVGALPYIEMVRPDLVVIEEPLLGRSRNIQTALKIGRTCGALMAALYASAGMERNVELVPVATWKAEVLGDGSADKQRICTWLHQNHPEVSALCGDDQDLRDAACIALYGQGLLGRVDALRSGLLDGARLA